MKAKLSYCFSMTRNAVPIQKSGLYTDFTLEMFEQYGRMPKLLLGDSSSTSTAQAQQPSIF
jgi:aminopeptidase C